MRHRYIEREVAREKAFEPVWANDLDTVFTEVASYYEHASSFASLGLWNRLQRRFVSTINAQPGYRVLDVCAGANAMGVALLKKQPNLDVFAVDRNMAMQEVGKDVARSHHLHITSIICDAHDLPFPDNHFDVVTLQWATRHLRVIKVFSEINRVLKSGGYFYNCDLSKPASKFMEDSYCAFLKTSLALVSRAFDCGPASLKCRSYFIQAIRMFYSTEELSEILTDLGFDHVTGKSVLGGTVAFHKGRKIVQALQECHSPA